LTSYSLPGSDDRSFPGDVVSRRSREAYRVVLGTLAGGANFVSANE
jgi:hypothetical protein